MKIEKVEMARTIQIKQYEPLSIKVVVEIDNIEVALGVSEDEAKAHQANFLSLCDNTADLIMKGLVNSKIAMRRVCRMVAEKKEAARLEKLNKEGEK